MNLRNKLNTFLNYQIGGKKVQKRDCDCNTSSSNNNVVVRYAGQSSYKGITSPNLALTNSVVYRGVSILSDAVASLPIDIYRKKSNGFWIKDENNPLHFVFNKKANQRQTPYELLEGTVVQAIMYGNAYIYIKRNVKGDVSELVLIYPNCTYFDEVKNQYTITDSYNGIKGIFTPDKIIHIRYKSLENLIGKPLTDYCAQTLGIANAVDKESMKSLSNGMRLRGIISTDSQVIGFSEETDDQLSDISENMKADLNSGADIIAMPTGVKFQSFSQTNRDSMILENKQYTLSDLARFLGVSPSKLYISQGGNYVASEQEQINFFTDTLNPLLVKVEQEFTNKLIPDSVYGKYKIEFNRMELPYYDTILDGYQKAVQLGLYSTNDVRRIFNLQPVDGGDDILLSANLMTLDALKAKGIVEGDENESDNLLSKNS